MIDDDELHYEKNHIFLKYMTALAQYYNTEHRYRMRCNWSKSVLMMKTWE